MVNVRRKLDGSIKAKIVVESLKGEKTIPELGSSYGVHPKMIQLWKRRALEGLPSLFSEKINRPEKEQGELIDELYRQIGQLKVELDWVKKNQVLSVDDARRCIEPLSQEISIARQCELLGLNRSSLPTH